MKTLHLWHTLQLKIISTVGIIFLLIAIAIIFFNFRLYRDELIKSMTDDAIRLNESIKNSLELAMLNDKRDEIQRSLEKISSDEEIIGLFISSKEGLIRIASNPELKETQIQISDTSCQICHSSNLVKSGRSFVRKEKNGSKILRTVSPILNQKACHECHDSQLSLNGVLFLDTDLASHDQQLSSYKLRSALIGGFTTVTLFGITLFLLNKLVIQRVKDLVHRIRSIGAGDYTGQIEVKGNDEFAILGKSVDRMRQQIQESFLKISHQRDYLQNVIDSMQDGLLVIDNNYRIVLVNKTLLQRIGKTVKQVVGLPCNEVFHDHLCDHYENREKCPSAIVFATGRLAHVFHHPTDKKESQVIEIFSSPLFDDKGNVIQSIEIIRDITEKKRLEDELMQSEKMALIGRLVAGVAHEINNPLATMATCTEGLLNRISETPEEKPIHKEKWFRQYLERIEKTIYRCKTIIEQLLVFSRSSKKNLEIFDLNRVVEETIHLISHRAEKEGKKIVISLSQSPVLIQGVPNKIGQLILNLIINGLDALKRDGEIVISTCQKDSGVCLVIQDDGIGIPEQEMDHIFEPFYTTKKSGKGTGLGLSICQQIVTEHDGKISVESMKGQGSKFEISLPGPA